MRLDEVLAWLDFRAHQDIEELIGVFGVRYRYLLENAVSRVHGRFP